MSVYRWPTFPFRPPPDYVGKPMDEKGAETLYVLRVNDVVANAGVAVIAAGQGALIHPWLLGLAGRKRRAGLPRHPRQRQLADVRVPARHRRGRAAVPRRGRYFVAVDSGSDEYTGQSFAGGYLLRTWQNDVRPPTIRLLTSRVAAGRSLIAARVTDAGSGVDPTSLVIGYRQVLVGAAAYDPIGGLALFPHPGRRARGCRPAGRRRRSSQPTSRSRRTSTRPAPTFCRTRASCRPAWRSSAGPR